jgi:chromosome segregation protein
MKSLRGRRGEDLIFNGSVGVAKMNHASVTITFDNKDKKFGLDFDEVSIARHVYRDGQNEYYLNNSRVRLKDIFELLSKISIGASSHHIISQGEADRFLNSNIFDRREMVEDALGLRVYQYKKAESERKLDKTEENIKEAEMIRRELAPHIKFLKKQVEQIEKAQELKRNLVTLYHDYLKREEIYLKDAREKINKEKGGPAGELSSIEAELGRISKELSDAGSADEGKLTSLRELERKINEIRFKIDDTSRQIGRLEGRIEAGLSNPFLSQAPTIEKERVCPTCGQSIKIGVDTSVESDFVKRKKSELEENKKQKTEAESLLSKLRQEEMSLTAAHSQLKVEIDAHKDGLRDSERKMFELRARKNELLSKLGFVKIQEEKILHEEDDFKKELTEAAILAGREVLNYSGFVIELDDPTTEPREAQEERRRKIERIKIRLEDMGSIGDEVVKEYNETIERDKFLEKEIADLQTSAASLREVMKELADKIEKEFVVGIERINKQFQAFFETLFGGGTAALTIVTVSRKKPADGSMEDEGFIDEEEGEPERGIDINVTLPKKKIRGLQVLSGGERSLTSIALLFAISQVNPPPFLILDETDAALDESNSRKYGEMIQSLAKYSQLLIITHNRETMNRADILYGITMGADGVSRILSIKFEEAQGLVKN